MPSLSRLDNSLICKSVSRLLALLGLAISFAVPASMAQDAMKIITPDKIVWNDDTLFKGAQYANLIGDASKAEPCVVRVKFPPNFKIPTHTHPWSEVLTILSGAFGEATDDADKGELLKAGSVLVVPANHTHRVFTTDEGTVFQFSFMGPFDITFVNPADDPRKKAQ
jgi:quercetin dioxygenase-like cupin family protein